jgi:hypothetical protein
MRYEFILLELLKCSCTFMPKSYKLQKDLALTLEILQKDIIAI